ncbi:UDP-glycosyltransferase UGT5 isoform X1 [Procambarus clarkii]|uniref:UDP-glycosyltransferase UGT5 isoform X1 n=1 Tax=Procambarus clarkii TaxID=6728 RepID=UPI0037445438
MRWWSVMVVTGALVVHQADAASILFLAPLGTISHKNFFMGIAEALAARNHTVTFVTGYRASKSQTNIREVKVPMIDMSTLLPNLFTRSQTSMLSLMPLLAKNCGDALRSQEFENIQEEKFDLVMISMATTECFYPFINKLKVPYIHMTPNSLHGALSDQAGNPHFPSMVPSYFLDRIYPLTFTGRMINTLSDLLLVALRKFYLTPLIAAEVDEGPALISAMRLNGSLYIANSVETLEVPPRPYVPTVVHAGGIHCRPAQPLPLDLEQWVAASGDAGFIFFSLGSSVKGSTMPDKYRRVLVEVFASLEQRILWKWDEDTMEDLPSNVRLAKWLPQQDILGDPRLRLFITHGGLLSTQEATYHAIPILGIPVFVDQHHNMRQAQNEGWGRSLAWDDLTYDLLRQNIFHVMDDTRMREEAERRAAVMRDQPMSPGDWVVYWVEYVIRHRGAPHLRSPFITMPWYEVYNVDVWVVVVMVVTLATYLSLRAVLALITCCCSSTTKPKQE